MILSDLLGRDVLDDTGAKIGIVFDARFVLDGAPETEASLAPARLYGFLVNPRSRGSSYLGYERKGLRAPWPIGRLERWWHRGSFLVRWEDVAGIGSDGVQLRPGYTRRRTALPEPGQRRRSRRERPGGANAAPRGGAGTGCGPGCADPRRCAG